MKKITTVLMMFIAVSSFAQLKVKEVEKEGELVGEHKVLGEMFGKMNKEQGYYVITYKDTKFQTQKVYKHFLFKESDFDTLYELFTNVEGKNDGDAMEVDLDTGDKLKIVYTQFSRKILPIITHIDKNGVEGTLFGFSEKHWAKIFGKKKK